MSQKSSEFVVVATFNGESIEHGFSFVQLAPDPENTLKKLTKELSNYSHLGFFVLVAEETPDRVEPGDMCLLPNYKISVIFKPQAEELDAFAGQILVVEFRRMGDIKQIHLAPATLLSCQQPGKYKGVDVKTEIRIEVFLGEHSWSFEIFAYDRAGK